RVAENITESTAPHPFARGIGAAVGYGIGKWPGLIAGRDIGPAIIPPMAHPLRMATGMIRAGLDAASDRPIIPPEFQSAPEQTSQTPSTTFGNQASRISPAPLSSEQKLLEPATQIQQ